MTGRRAKPIIVFRERRRLGEAWNLARELPQQKHEKNMKWKLVSCS